MSGFATQEQFIKKAINTHGDIYNYSNVDYIRSSIKVSITCNKHGDFLQRPGDHIKGSGCPICKKDKIRKSLSWTLDDFINKANKVHDFKYDYSKTIYINNKDKVIIICPEHGEFVQEAHCHTSGVGCPKCRISKGELAIKRYLELENIFFEEQKGFSDCKNPETNYILRFDFYIPDRKLCIEFNGAQHYRSVEYWGGEEAFVRQKFRDSIKASYCLNNKIKLLHIPYWKQKNIEQIIEKELNNVSI